MSYRHVPIVVKCLALIDATLTYYTLKLLNVLQSILIDVYNYDLDCQP